MNYDDDMIIFWSSWSYLNWKLCSLFFFPFGPKTHTASPLRVRAFSKKARCAKLGAPPSCGNQLMTLVAQTLVDCTPRNPRTHGTCMASRFFRVSSSKCLGSSSRKSTENLQHLCYVTVPVSKKPWCLSSSISPTLSGIKDQSGKSGCYHLSDKKPITSHYTQNLFAFIHKPTI